MKPTIVESDSNTRFLLELEALQEAGQVKESDTHRFHPSDSRASGNDVRTEIATWRRELEDDDHAEQTDRDCRKIS